MVSKLYLNKAVKKCSKKFKLPTNLPLPTNKILKND